MAFLTVNWFSSTMIQCITTSVILPEGKPPAHGYPVLWLLHGMGNDHSTWGKYTSMERYAQDYGIAVVMPDGGLSNYADMTHGHPYYTTITKELYDVMGGLFPLSDRLEDNWIAGNSMGGGGALKIGLANPEKFSAIGCFSAGDTVFPFPDTEPGELPEVDALLKSVYDGRDKAGTEEDVLGNAQKIVDQGLPAPRIFHIIGKDDFLLKAAHKTRDYFTSLPGNPFDYTYVETEGAHNWAYWDAHIVEFLRFVRG